jgi:RNA polymerase sigma factor (sigma-70 family)
MDEQAGGGGLAKLLGECRETVAVWSAQAGVERWGISEGRFTEELVRCAEARFRGTAPSRSELQGYLGTLHLEDLRLACACADAVPEAWEYFVGQYRGYLRGCAAVLLNRSAGAPEAEELADSLFAELYGLSAEKRGSLLRYFHGRSSLKTWLRAVLAQRHVDKIRAERKFEELPDENGGFADGAHRPGLSGTVVDPVGDPHRARYLQLFTAALTLALKKVEAQDAVRLRMYYAEERKLAEIGRVLGEHESSVSRHLEKVRRNLRAAVEGILRGGGAGPLNGDTPLGGQGLSDAEIALCFEYAAEDAPIDLDKLFSQGETGGAAPSSSEV